MSHDVFISYSHANTAMMESIRDSIEANGLTYWVDEKLIPGTPAWHSAIAEAIQTATCVVVLASPESLASRWVKTELDYALEFKKPVLPLLISGDRKSSIPFVIFSIQHVDLREEYDANIKRAIKAIKNIVPSPPSQTLLDEQDKENASRVPHRTPISRYGCNLLVKLHNLWLKFSLEVKVAIVLALVTGIIVPTGIGIFNGLPQEQRDHILHQLGIVAASPTPTNTATPPFVPSPTPQLPLQIFSISKPSPSGDIWMIQLVPGRPSYEEKDYLVVYKPAPPNSINGDQAGEPIAKVRVVNKTDDYLYIQVVLKHPNFPIQNGYIVDNKLEHLNTGDLVPTYDKAVGYIADGFVYLRPNFELADNSVLKILEPIQQTNEIEIRDYLQTQPRMQVVGFSEERRVAIVILLDGATQMPENGTLVILANPPTPVVPTTFVPISTDTPIEIPTTLSAPYTPTSTASLTPTNTPSPSATYSPTPTPKATSTVTPDSPSEPMLFICVVPENAPPYLVTFKNTNVVGFITLGRAKVKLIGNIPFSTEEFNIGLNISSGGYERDGGNGPRYEVTGAIDSPDMPECNQYSDISNGSFSTPTINTTREDILAIVLQTGTYTDMLSNVFSVHFNLPQQVNTGADFQIIQMSNLPIDFKVSFNDSTPSNFIILSNRDFNKSTSAPNDDNIFGGEIDSDEYAVLKSEMSQKGINLDNLLYRITASYGIYVSYTPNRFLRIGIT